MKNKKNKKELPAKQPKTKKWKIFLFSLLSVLVVAGVVGGIVVINTPHYALYQMSRDIKVSGIEGLTPYLEGDAKTTVDTIQTLSENQTMQSIFSIFVGGESEYLSILKSHMEDIQWEVTKLERQGKTAYLTLQFNYDEKLVGTIDADMEKREGDWKITKIDMPKFTTIKLQESK